MQAKKEKEREEKERRKEKERKEKEREREREKGKERSKKDETDGENVDVIDSHSYKEDKKREKDKDRKHRKRHQSTTDDVSSDKDEKEESKKSRRHGSDRKKSRKVSDFLFWYILVTIYSMYNDCKKFFLPFLMFLCSMPTHLNQIVKTGIKDTREITEMVEEVADWRTLRMANLVRMGNSSSSYIPFWDC